jgi:hypothetical protein
MQVVVPQGLVPVIHPPRGSVPVLQAVYVAPLEPVKHSWLIDDLAVEPLQQIVPLQA